MAAERSLIFPRNINFIHTNGMELAKCLDVSWMAGPIGYTAGGEGLGEGLQERRVALFSMNIFASSTRGMVSP